MPFGEVQALLDAVRPQTDRQGAPARGVQVVHEGQRVRVRGRIWEVREAPQVEGGQILTLAPVADSTAPDLKILYPVERVEVLDHQQTGWHVGSGHGFQLLHDGVRLSLKTPPDRILANRLGRLQVEPYQFDPVLKAFRRPLQRLLIADDVGLGKTVEAILIMLELIARGRGNRILIVVPAGLQDQWRDDELYRKAGLEFEIFDSDRIRELRREYARGTNPWTTRNRVIASMDFLKRDDIRRMLKGVMWDLVIVDEAHYLAESVSGNNVYKTARSRLGEFLASTQVTDNLILLTATPHSGYVRGFYSLLKLIDPFLTPRDDRLDRKVIDPILVRRSKREIFEADGVTRRFKDPEINTIAVTMAPAEEELYRQVDQYTKRQFKRAGKDTAVGFAMTILKKRLMSSLPALVASLETRAEHLTQDLIDVKADRGLIQDYRKGVPLTEEQTHRVEERLIVASLTEEDAQQSLDEQEKHRERDRAEIRKLLKLARSLDPAEDSKARALIDKLKEVASGPDGEKVIIFTESRDTLEFLAGKDTSEGHVDGLLDRAGFKGQIVTLTGGMARNDRRAVEAAFHRPHIRLLVATDAASEGLNLQKQCRQLIHYELPWNPNRMIQRNGRIDRWGQKSVKPVQIFNLYRPKAKDDDILALLLWKIEEIRRDLGSAADVIGASSELDIETLLLTRGGIKQDEDDARQSKEEAEQAIQKSLSDQRQRMAQWQSESVLASARFGKEDHLRVERELAAGGVDLVGEAGIQALVQEVLARLQGHMEPAGPERFRIVIPQSLRRGGLAREELPAATFNRSLAAAAEAEDLEFLGVSHSLVQSAATRIRASLWDPQGILATDRIASRIVESAPGLGIVFTFLGLLSQKRYRDGRTLDPPYAEYLLPVFVSLEGDASEDMSADHGLLDAPAAPGTLPAKAWEERFRPALATLMEPAREEARRRLQAIEKQVRQRVAQQAETLRRDALEWRDAREQWIQEQLAAPTKNQLFYDDEGEHITWQDASERRERRLKNERARLQLLLGQRISEIEAMGQVQGSGELTWVGALLVVPSYELPHLTGKGR